MGDDALASTLSMRQGPPDPDPLAIELGRARTEQALFGKAEPARLGRYEILEPLASGGMGMVYVARDPELGRSVALKLVHPRRNHDTRSRQRLVIEGRALAKLDHPNVVKVHDVIAHDGHVVIVMELVKGETLESWEQRALRSWPEVIAVYLQAGDGLAAAHGLDVIHRDFKPSNAIIGSDGRVRVLDFGLARVTTEDDPVGGPASAAAPDLTATGDVLGTLAYSAPEQLEGRTATAASDQFSFCVSLHRAVEGLAAFDGATPQARLASIRSGRIARARDDRRVPAWLRAVIARGLSIDPALRYPTVSELLRELRRPRGWRRWRLRVLATALVIGGIAVARIFGPPSVDLCDGGKTQSADVWDAAQRARVGEAIAAIGTPYAREVQERVVSTLDGYRSAWSAAHRASCRAHREGAISGLLLDRQMACLAQRLGELRVAGSVLAQVDAGSLANAMDVAVRIPPPSSCTDLERMQAEVAPPATPALRAVADLVRARVHVAEALARGGRTEAALATAVEAASRARATRYPPLQIDAGLAEGRIRIARQDLLGARAALLPVREWALEHQMLPAAIEAAARLIYVEGMLAPDLPRIERDVAYVLPLSAGLRGDDFARPLLLNNIGVVYQAAGRRPEAVRYFESARSALRGRDPVDLELTCIDINLAMLTADDSKRNALITEVWERLRGALGENHLATLDALVGRGEYVLDPAQAFALMSEAAERYQRFHPEILRLNANTETRRAFLATEMGDLAQARALYSSALARGIGPADDEDVVHWYHLNAGELAILNRDSALAVAELSITREARIASALWWEEGYALRADVGLGLAEIQRGDDRAALRYLEEAVRRYPAVMAHTEQVEYRRLFARAQRELASALRRIGADLDRAAQLAQDARTFHRNAGYRWLLTAPSSP